LAVEESVFETLRIKRYGRLVVLLTPAMKIISYDFNMLGYDYSIPQPVILHELGALMQQFQQYQQDAVQANASDGPKPHEVMQIALTAIANLGHGFEAEVHRATPLGVAAVSAGCPISVLPGQHHSVATPASATTLRNRIQPCRYTPTVAKSRLSTAPACSRFKDCNP